MYIHTLASDFISRVSALDLSSADFKLAYSCLKVWRKTTAASKKSSIYTPILHIHVCTYWVNLISQEEWYHFGITLYLTYHIAKYIQIFEAWKFHRCSKSSDFTFEDCLPIKTFADFMHTLYHMCVWTCDIAKGIMHYSKWHSIKRFMYVWCMKTALYIIIH